MLMMLFVVGFELPIGAQTYYVDAAFGDDAASGRSWEEAFQTLVRGLDAARAVADAGGAARVNVAEGTYLVANEMVDFVVVIVGGYPAGGGLRSRSMHESQLDAQGAGTALNFVLGSNGSIVDGIHVTGSNGRALDIRDWVTVRNCVISDNEGLGILAIGGRLERNELSRNELGGIFAFVPGGYQCDPSAWRLDVIGNSLEGNRWRGIYAKDLCEEPGQPVLFVYHNRIASTRARSGETNAGLWLEGAPDVFNNEILGTDGNGLVVDPYFAEAGGMHIEGPSWLSSITVSNNSGPAIRMTQPDLVTSFTISHSVLWDNVGGDIDGLPSNHDISYTLSEAPLPGTGNISGTDPLLVAGPNAQSYLSQLAAGQAADSPAVDAGGMTAEEAGLAFRTTRTDGVRDSGVVDLGFHAEPESFTLYRSRDPQALLAHIPDISLPVVDSGAAAQGPRDLLFYEVDLDDEILVRRRDTDVEVRFRYQEYD